MEILFYRYNSICEPDIMQVFNSFGITVHTEEMEMYDKHTTPRQCAEKLTEWITEHSLAFVFSINFFPAISYTCNRFKIPYVCWSVDSPVPELFSNALKNEWNRVFLFDRAQYEIFHPVNPQHIYYLPLATNTKRWENVILSMQDEDFVKYDSDVSFVGSLYTEKCRYDQLLQKPASRDTRVISKYTQGFVDGLIETQLKTYGCNFIADSLTDRIIREIADSDPDFYSENDTYTNADRYLIAHQYIGMKLAAVERERTLNRLAKHFRVTLYTRSDTSTLNGVDRRDGVNTLTEMPKVFHASRINLNITMRPIETGLSLRIWDVLGCGGFLLTNYQAEIPEYFEIGRDLETYESMEELEQKIQYYLTHEEERIEIAINGYEKVAAYHTWEQRITEMIRILSK
ncbi:MAG: glycosyltransferase [Lachnospiraceae bacterium]|nr:glycosyltransferase [Lachnospiraceae bacterium]